MSDARNSSDDNSLLDLTFDPSDATTPSLRPPNLSDAQLQAALTFGFCQKYLPSSVTGGGGGSGPGPDILDTNSSRSSQSASMTNNHSNYNSNQSGGSQNQYPLFVDNYTNNLTEEQLLGLLPPLRRPDIHQIPPDVLAVLLKSNRLDDILLPPQQQRRYTEAPPTPPVSFNNQSPQQMRPSQPQQRQPQEFSTPQQHNTAAIASHQPPPQQQRQQQQQRFQNSSRFNLSPLAKEFVPTFQSRPSMNPQQHQPPQQQQDLAYAMSYLNVQNQNDPFPSFQEEEWDNSDCVLSTVTDMITKVSEDPASLNRWARTAVNVLKKHLRDEVTLGVVVTLLVEQMISNTNFCYSGAKIFEILRENNIRVEKSTIKTVVLGRMQELFTQSINSLDDPTMLDRTHGVLRVLCELFMNFQAMAPNGEKSKYDIIALAALELMQKLIQKDKSLESVKCVSQLFKLIGWEVENSKNEKVRNLFEQAMKELSLINTSEDKNLHPTCKILVDNILKLQSKKWGKEEEDPAPTSSSTTETAYNPYSKNAVLYYDEVPESDDDSFGGDGAIMIDDEPDEVQAAYEEFLKMSSKK